MVRLRPPEEAFCGITSSRPVSRQKHLLSNSGRQRRLPVKSALDLKQERLSLMLQTSTSWKEESFCRKACWLRDEVPSCQWLRHGEKCAAARSGAAEQRVSHCLPCPAAVSGHMFEGELMFRIDRIMPEFQVRSSDPRTSNSIVSGLFMHTVATSRAGSSPS